MKTSYPTIAQIFPHGDLGWLDQIESEQEIVALHDSADKEASIVEWSIILDEVKAEIETLLDIAIPEVLAGAWNSAGMLVQYLNKEKYPVDETVIVPLVEHTIESSHHPYIEVLIDDMPMGKVHLDIEIEMNLEGFNVKLQNGRIKAIATGLCKAKGSIAIQGVTIAEEEMKPISLPGVIRLQEGIEITF